MYTSARNKKTYGFKPILVSPENHAWITKATNKSQIFNDVITELLNTKSINRAEVLQGPQVGAQALVVPESKGELRSNG